MEWGRPRDRSGSGAPKVASPAVMVRRRRGGGGVQRGEAVAQLVVPKEVQLGPQCRGAGGVDRRSRRAVVDWVRGGGGVMPDGAGYRRGGAVAIGSGGDSLILICSSKEKNRKDTLP